MDPNALTGTDWADFTAVYDEFRVLGAHISLYSSFPNSTTASNNVAVIAFDNDSATAAGSFTAVRQFNNSKTFSALMTHNAGKGFEATWWRPTIGLETPIPWIDINSSSSSLGSILLYADGLNNSTTYLVYVIDLYVELRGRR